MSNNDAPQSPSVHNLISFWSELELPVNGQGRDPARSRSRETQAVSTAENPVVFTKPLPPNRRSSPSRLPSSPGFPSSSKQDSSRTPAPLFPLRSVAPAQSRVFGTKRHSLDTIGSSSPSSSQVHIRRNPRLASGSGPATTLVEATKPADFLVKSVERSTHHSDQARHSGKALPLTTSLPTYRPQPPQDTPRRATSPQAAVKQSKGIIKLAVIPPVQEKHDTLKNHQHAVRSHPTVLSEVLQPSLKSNVSSRSVVDLQHQGQDEQQVPLLQRDLVEHNDHLEMESRTTAREIRRPMSESLEPAAATSFSDDQQNPRSQGDEDESRASGMMYAVVKGVPGKPPKPKLVGATGSGTVITPRAGQDGSTHSSVSGNRILNPSTITPDSQSRPQSGKDWTGLPKNSAEFMAAAVNLPAPNKYAGGTPFGTNKSEHFPEESKFSTTEPLFQPTAPLVAFPVLDAYLSSLRPAVFSEVKTTSITSLAPSLGERTALPHPGDNKLDTRDGMFPPLDKVPIGITLDELKINVTKPPGFFDQELQNVMLSSAVDGIMSGESSNIGISWMRLEIIRDFLQFVALYLSVSGNTFVNQKWLYATVNIIPALLSLDFPRAVGYGMVFLILFALICFIALYTFKIMTRTDPNDDIEGLEVSSWSLRSKKQRIETISIVFLLTTLYLPLAKLSLDALVWSDTMWPISNPYTSTDHPVFEPLGPSGVYRDPSDFCYVTSMKIQDLNFAYAIIPLAIFTLCANTLYFPLAIRRLVVVNLPRIDRYTEQGERRLDLDEEYKRLTNSDNCPYNFLYNGYRREHGTYKVVVMFTKLLAVIIVVLFSKDNCLFRSYDRRTIEATRAGLQIVFTASLIYRHYRTQPFLYASQNLSEYWSRACTVATSVIGLFIVLKVGPVSVNALGVMLVATYVLMCVVVIWFVVRQTQKFQVILKQIQQRLDFSLDIFNPKLNYFKHIKRRIWQETWTTMLLVEDSYKMPADKVVAYSQSPQRPPYLLNFKGTVAERHVENLRIVRQIGLRSYSQACQFLTPAVVCKRNLILKEFVGPDMYYAPEFMTSNIKTYFGKAYVVPFPFSVVFVYDESSVVVTLVKEHDLDRYIQQNQDSEIQRRRELRYQLRALDGKFVVRPFIDTRDVQRSRESNGTMGMSLVNAPVSYKRGLFTIHRKKMSNWQGHNMNPGFSVTITYSDGEVQDPEGSTQLLHETSIGHDVIGITRDFQLTPALTRLLRDNHALVSRGVKKVKKVMQSYQAHYRNEAHQKDATLSYDFFINVYDNPTLKHKELGPLLMATEENPKVNHPSPEVAKAINFLYERMAAVNRTRCHQWWYLFWDDLYRKNHDEIPQLVPKDFSPAFPGSICYRPMSRSELEAYLEQRGCWQKKGRAGFMHVGVLNRMYTFLNDLVFDRMTKEQQQRQLELTATERQRLEQQLFVTKAQINGNGTYKRLPVEAQDGQTDAGVSRYDFNVKPAAGLTGQKKGRKGWFESITPGRGRKQMSHPRIDNYSPAYIIPQTWQQKASQFTALLIGGRPEDMIGQSDEEDDIEENQNGRRKSMSSLESPLIADSSAGYAPDQKADAGPKRGKQEKSNAKRHQEPRTWNKISGREESWASMSTLTAVESDQREELIPLTQRHSWERRADDFGGVSDPESITSMSSEDYW